MRTAAISASAFLYTRMLRWYPPDLQIEFREDMMDVFQENLENCWKRSSWRGVAKAWLDVGRDLTGIVLPYRMRQAAPFLLGILCAILFCATVLAAIDPDRK